MQTIDFFTDVVTTQEEKGIEEAITGGIRKEEGKSAGMLSPRGSLTVDQRTNSLIVRDVPDNLAKIKDFVDRVDRPAPSIHIEARLVEMSRQDARSLGVIWGGVWTPRATSTAPSWTCAALPPGGPISGETAGAADPHDGGQLPGAAGYADQSRSPARPPSASGSAGLPRTSRWTSSSRPWRGRSGRGPCPRRA